MESLSRLDGNDVTEDDKSGDVGHLGKVGKETRTLRVTTTPQRLQHDEIF